MKFLKYMAGSLIISFGILFVLIILLRSLQIQAPNDIFTYLGLAWVGLAIILYPVAKKFIRV
jgi:hypothetical protein